MRSGACPDRSTSSATPTTCRSGRCASRRTGSCRRRAPNRSRASCRRASLRSGCAQTAAARPSPSRRTTRRRAGPRTVAWRSRSTYRPGAGPLLPRPRRLELDEGSGAVKVVLGVFKLIFSRWMLLAIGILALAMLVWWIGPTVSISNFRPYESALVRCFQIELIALSPVVRTGWRWYKGEKGNAAIADGLLKAPAPVGPDAKSEEATQLRQRFEEALGLLKQIRFGAERPTLWTRLRTLGSQQHLYNLPWYVFIGAPGAGKTTALINSGLRFPLADRLGREAVRGVGRARQRDRWVTDTPGVPRPAC